eukprot:scaffold8629_cov114-Isochrysis_galbana.AAC.9
MADCGMIDAFRLVHGDTRAGYSRLAHTIDTRIDRIYTQAHASVWRWHVGTPHAPERGVGRPPRNSPPPSEHEVKVPSPASLCLPCLVATCLGSVLVFVLRELDPPLPPRKGGYRVGAQTTTNLM